ncbi:MAG: glycosyltransferase family 2 protein, partial [Anaerolineae bacterium]|nr:glycosyltransferase family 2 protein [Anaerolineae bacterium]
MSDLVTVVIPAWNGRRDLPACLDALLSQQANVEIVVVDNGSGDGSADLVAECYPQVRLIRHRRNQGFAGGCNAGLQAARGDLLILLNQDTVVQAGWLQAVASAAQDRQVGVVGCKILESDGKTLNHCGGVIDMASVETQHIGAGELDRGQYDEAADVEYVTGAAFALRRDVLEQVGLLDERFFPGYYEDTDYCLRVHQAGYRIRYVPDAVVIHHVSTSTRQDWVRRRFYYYRNRLIFALKHLAPRDLVTRFVPPECERVGTLSPAELYAVQIALYDVLACWPFLAAELHPKAASRD